MEKLTEKQYAAIQCAVFVLEGTAGGYTPKEKMEAKLELMEMLKAGVKQ
jgi:hypothetical protein